MLWKPKADRHVDRSLSSIPDLKHIQLVHIFKAYLRLSAADGSYSLLPQSSPLDMGRLSTKSLHLSVCSQSSFFLNFHATYFLTYFFLICAVGLWVLRPLLAASDRRLGGPESRSGRRGIKTNLFALAVQHVARRYTD
jgi:hypothetical protein